MSKVLNNSDDLLSAETWLNYQTYVSDEENLNYDQWLDAYHYLKQSLSVFRESPSYKRTRCLTKVTYYLFVFLKN